MMHMMRIKMFPGSRRYMVTTKRGKKKDAKTGDP
jgi:hypothetical protein